MSSPTSKSAPVSRNQAALLVLLSISAPTAAYRLVSCGCRAPVRWSAPARFCDDQCCERRQLAHSEARQRPPASQRLARCTRRGSVCCSCPAGAAVDLSGDGGCMKQTLRAALPRAQTVEPGSVVSVFFSASLADGTLLRSNRGDQPLEIRVGAQPSDAVCLENSIHVQLAGSRSR
jgi:hypothetical protein|eukprot:6759259-Prymnesium_polylepis.2